MNLITREELREKLDRGDEFKLVMVMDGSAFRASHIPGSINIYVTDITNGELDPEDEIIVYCNGFSCPASVGAYQRLEAAGYNNVRRYAGGIPDWEDAQYPLEGECEPRKSTKEAGGGFSV